MGSAGLVRRQLLAKRRPNPDLPDTGRRLGVSHRDPPRCEIDISPAQLEQLADPQTSENERGEKRPERARQVASIAAVQNHYNLSERTHEDVVAYCAENGIVFVPNFPLRDGGSVAAEIAKRQGATPEQVALAWAAAALPGDAADPRHPCRSIT
jgi:hypothetical protein